MVAHQEDVVSRMTRVPTHQEISRSCLFCVEGNALRPEDPKAGWGAMKALSKSGLLLTFCLELFSMVLFFPYHPSHDEVFSPRSPPVASHHPQLHTFPECPS